MANFWGSHKKCCVTHWKDEERCQWEEECEWRREKPSLLCRAALEKRGNQGPDVGWQHLQDGLIQQELLTMKWDTDTQGSQHWAAWDGGDFTASPFLPWTLSAEKGSGEIKGKQEEGDALGEGRVWGRQARKHWEMGAEWLCYARGTKVSHFLPKPPPPVPGLNHRCFPSNWPFPFTCFKSTVIYSALLPHPPPAVRGSCRNCCSSGDTDGKVSLSETERPAGLFSHSNAYHKCSCISFLHRSAVKHQGGKKISPVESELLAFPPKFETNFATITFPIGNDEPWEGDTPQALGGKCHKYSWLLGCAAGSCKVKNIFL